jgi:hypothetical protein
MQAGQDCRVESVDRNVKLRELLVGVEGLALLRHLYDRSSADAEERIAEVHRLLEDDAFSAGERMREEDSRTGYRALRRTRESGYRDRGAGGLVAA